MRLKDWPGEGGACSTPSSVYQVCTCQCGRSELMSSPVQVHCRVWRTLNESRADRRRCAPLNLPIKQSRIQLPASAKMKLWGKSVMLKIYSYFPASKQIHTNRTACRLLICSWRDALNRQLLFSADNPCSVLDRQPMLSVGQTTPNCYTSTAG